MSRQAFDEMVSWSLRDLSPGKVAAVLREMADRLGDVEPVGLTRYEVHPSAVALRDVLVESLEGVERLGRYETTGWMPASLRTSCVRRRRVAVEGRRAP